MIQRLSSTKQSLRCDSSECWPAYCLIILLVLFTPPFPPLSSFSFFFCLFTFMLLTLFVSISSHPTSPFYFLSQSVNLNTCVILEAMISVAMAIPPGVDHGEKARRWAEGTDARRERWKGSDGETSDVLSLGQPWVSLQSVKKKKTPKNAHTRTHAHP